MVAVLIAYLPTIYGAFSRREVMVTQLSVRAGTPPTPWRLLELAHRAGYLNELDPVWNEWMQWFCEVSETHTSLVKRFASGKKLSRRSTGENGKFSSA